MRNRHIRRGTQEARDLDCQCAFIAIDRRGAESSILGYSEVGPGWTCPLHAPLKFCREQNLTAIEAHR